MSVLGPLALATQEINYKSDSIVIASVLPFVVAASVNMVVPSGPEAGLGSCQCCLGQPKKYERARAEIDSASLPQLAY